MNKKISIMQPYFFPYIGYFQLVNLVDKFVFFDDVNFIKRGWVNRNRILVNGEPFFITIPCKNASQNVHICDTEISFGSTEKAKLLNTIRHAYLKSPYFKDIFLLVEGVVHGEHNTISDLAIASVLSVVDYLDINTDFKLSSELKSNSELKGKDRMIDICKKENFCELVNPSGGVELYSKSEFKDQGIDLFFINTKPITYKQFNAEFVGYLSILDVLFFNDKLACKQLLNEFTLT